MGSKVMLGGKLLFPSDYVSAPEFQGRDVTLTIATVRIEELKMTGGKKEAKPTISFKETKKKLVLNKTNAASIAESHGNKAEAWVGQRITLYPTQTRFGSQVVDCIRVRENGSVKKGSPPTDTPFNEHDADPADADDGDVFGNGNRGGEPSSPQGSSAPAPAPTTTDANDPSGAEKPTAPGGQEHKAWPSTLPDEARKTTTFIDDAINHFRDTATTTRHTATKKFRALHSPDSWEKAAPAIQDALYAKLMTDGIDWS